MKRLQKDYRMTNEISPAISKTGNLLHRYVEIQNMNILVMHGQSGIHDRLFGH